VSRIKNIIAFTTVAITTAVSGVSQAWEPTKTVTSVIGFTPGSGNELIFRIVADQVEKNTGVKFIVLNKAGAGSAIANKYIVDQPADGHHLLVASLPAITATDKIVVGNPGYTLNDFTYGLMLGYSPMAFIAHPTDPVNSIQDFIKTLNTVPVTFGDPGSAARLTYELLAQSIKFPVGKTGVARIEYKGPMDTINDVIGQHVRFGVVPSSLITEYFRGQRVKVIAITSSTPSKLLPGVPTMNSVYPDFEYTLNWGLLFPKNTPQEIANWYSTEFSKALDNDAVREKLASNSMFVNKQLQSPDAFKAYAQRDQKKFESIVTKVIESQTSK